MPYRHVHLSETVTFQEAGKPLEIDETQGIVKDVRVLGWESKNGRRYLREALADPEAQALYRGARCNLDHASEQESARSVRDRFGIFPEGVRLTHDGYRADFRFNPQHPFAPTFLWWARHCPEAIGFSHNAEGEGEETEDGTFLVRRITAVHSIDLVADPATTQGLRESVMKKKLSALLREAAARCPDSETLRHLADAEYGDADMEVEDPAGGERSARELLAAAVAALAQSEDPADHELAAKVLRILRPEEEMTGRGEEDKEVGEDDERERDKEVTEDDEEEDKEMAEEDDEEKDKEMAEEDDEEKEKHVEALVLKAIKDPGTRRLAERTFLAWRRQRDAYRTRERIRRRRTLAQRLCREAGLPAVAISSTFLEVLLGCKDQETMRGLIEDRRQLLAHAGGSKRPRSLGRPQDMDVTLKQFEEMVLRDNA